MRDLLRAAGDLVLGVRCAGCAAPGHVLCAACRSLVGGRPAVRVPDPVPDGLLLPAPVVPVSLTSYDGVVVDVLHAYKEEPRTALAGPLGSLLAVAVRVALGAAEDLGAITVSPQEDASVVLVPVPSRRRAVRSRGFDAGAQLARATAAALRRQGIRARAEPVLRVGRVADQAGLGAAERAANLAGAYRLRRVPTGGTVVVTDDVLTTGASAAEAVRALTSAGSRPLAVATLAATRRRRPSSQGSRR